MADDVFQASSLDAPIDDDGDSVSIGDLIGADDPAIEHAVDMASVWTHWHELPSASSDC